MCSPVIALRPPGSIPALFAVPEHVQTWCPEVNCNLRLPELGPPATLSALGRQNRVRKDDYVLFAGQQRCVLCSCGNKAQSIHVHHTCVVSPSRMLLQSSILSRVAVSFRASIRSPRSLSSSASLCSYVPKLLLFPVYHPSHGVCSVCSATDAEALEMREEDMRAEIYVVRHRARRRLLRLSFGDRLVD